jgi:hypothetical protein
MRRADALCGAPTQPAELRGQLRPSAPLPAADRDGSLE